MLTFFLVFSVLGFTIPHSFNHRTKFHHVGFNKSQHTNEELNNYSRHSEFHTKQVATIIEKYELFFYH